MQCKFLILFWLIARFIIACTEGFQQPVGPTHAVRERYACAGVYCSRSIYLQFAKYLRSVILPSIIQANARRRVSLVKTTALFPVGNMTLLINLKKAEHPKIYIAAREENNRLERVCFVALDRTASKKTNKCMGLFLECVR